MKFPWKFLLLTLNWPTQPRWPDKKDRSVSCDLFLPPCSCLQAALHPSRPWYKHSLLSGLAWRGGSVGNWTTNWTWRISWSGNGESLGEGKDHGSRGADFLRRRILSEDVFKGAHQALERENGEVKCRFPQPRTRRKGRGRRSWCHAHLRGRTEGKNGSWSRPAALAPRTSARPCGYTPHTLPSKTEAGERNGIMQNGVRDIG